MQLKSIQQKITLWAGACLFLTSAIYVAYATSALRDTALTNAREQAVYIAQTEANKVKAELEQAMIAARTLGEALRRIKDPDAPISLSRDTVNAMLKTVNESNPQFIGVYTNWEPNAFDGQDSQFINAKGHDATGRFLPYWEKNAAGQVQVTPLIDYDKEGPGDYYQVPKRTMKESVVGPYVYPVAGRQVTMASFLEPIVVNNKFYGIMGVDLLLDFLQGQVDKVDIYERTGKLALVNNEGVFTAMTGRPEVANKKIAEAAPELVNTLAAIKAGEQLVELGAEYLKVVVPLTIGRTTTPWAAVITVPTEKILAPVNSLAYKQILIGLVLLALALAVLWFLAGRVAQPIKAAARFAHQLANGLLAEKVWTSAADETGQLIASMNDMLDNTNSLVQSQQERDRIQESIMKLLTEVSSVADGDLTREAEVIDGMTGAIADAFNYMIANLRQLIGKVQDVSTQVTSTASATQTAAEQLAQGSQEQAAQIVNTSTALNEMTSAIKRVSENADKSAQVANLSLETARKGAHVVQNTVQGMSRIQEQVQETARRIRQLHERSQEIEEILQLIEEIADRTGVLALNASIQAVTAGEAGRGFAVVAQEVEQLAGHSADATKRISNLVRAIQGGTNDAIAAMEETTREVVGGAKLANQAGQSLGEIESVSQQLADLVRLISQACQQQARSSETLSRTMTQIAASTNQTTSGVMQSAVTVKNLAGLADELRASVASFKIVQNGHHGQSSHAHKASGNGFSYALR